MATKTKKKQQENKKEENHRGATRFGNVCKNN